MTLLQKYIKSLKDVKLLESKKNFEWTIAVINEFGLDLGKSRKNNLDQFVIHAASILTRSFQAEDLNVFTTLRHFWFYK